MTVSAHYVGVAFSTGEEFDASWNRGQPLDFRARRRPGHRRAGTRASRACASAAAARSRSRRGWRYGDRGAGGAIKPGETLIFVVDLVDAR